LCEGGLSAVLTEARQLSPPVWLARLDEIAGWWRSRTETSFKIAELGGGAYHFVVSGANGTSVLIRAAETDVPTLPWADNYRQLEATTFTIHAPLRPLIGISPDASPKLINFLMQQGYLVEISNQRRRYSHYVDATQFSPGQERGLLAQIENGSGPLVRLGRWPNNARSALAVTGDIDALTLWDYSLRFVGN
jgi:hypothetical protein